MSASMPIRGVFNTDLGDGKMRTEPSALSIAKPGSGTVWISAPSSKGGAMLSSRNPLKCGSTLIRILSYCVVTVFVGIAICFQIRTGKTEPRHPVLVEHVFINDRAPHIKPKLPCFPSEMFGCSQTQLNTFWRHENPVAFRRNQPKRLEMFIATIINDLSRFGLFNRGLVEQLTCIGN